MPRPGSDQSPAPHRSRGVVSEVAGSLDRVVQHLPDWSRPIIAVLLLLVMALGLRALVSGRRARRLERVRLALGADVEVLQAALVPALPERIGATQLSVAYRPAGGLASGGDFYDAFALRGDRTAIVLGDVSGHDRSAIARADAVRHKLRAYLELGLDPRAVLHAAGEALASDSADGEFVTTVVAIHDGRDGSLTYACAGHPAPILTGRAAHEPVSVCSSAPLGWGLPTGRRQTTVVLAPGESAWFFTDGLVEARVGGTFLGREGLERLVSEVGERGGASGLLDAVREAAPETTDDLAVLAIRSDETMTTDAAPRIEDGEFDADGVARNAPRLFLAACGVTGARVDEIADLVSGVVAECDRAVLRVCVEAGADSPAGVTASVEPSRALASVA